MSAQSVPLRDRRGRLRAFALVDEADWPRVSARRWCLHSQGYAVGGDGDVLLHRFILGLERGDHRQVDHENFDRLDCRRENMRVVPPGGNQQNRRSKGGTSRFRGVSWSARHEAWRVQVGGRDLGFYDDEVEAAVAAHEERRRRMPFALPDPELVKLGRA